MLNGTRRSIQQLTWTVLLAALIPIGGVLQIPIGPVPISLQTFFVLLAGLLLGPAHGVLAVVLYLVAGLLGLPVFAGGASGVGVVQGPTGGFLLGFLPMVWIAGLAVRGREEPLDWERGLSWATAATALNLAIGVPWLKLVTGMGWEKTLEVGLFPFLPGAALKILASVAVCRFLEKPGWFSRR